MAERKRISRSLRLPASVLVLVLAGCGGAPPAPPPAPPPPPAPGAAAPGPPGSPAAASVERPPAAPAATGLVPLPTARQVIAALPLGRSDPFASPFPPLPPLQLRTPAQGARAGGGSGGASSTSRAQGAAGVASQAVAGAGPVATGVAARGLPAPLTLPPGFRVTGVIRSGRSSEAVVAFGDRSGSVRPGDRGGLTTDLLPGGWSVAAVDVNRGRVLLQHGRRRVTAEL